MLSLDVSPVGNDGSGLLFEDLYEVAIHAWLEARPALLKHAHINSPRHRETYKNEGKSTLLKAHLAGRMLARH